MKTEASGIKRVQYRIATPADASDLSSLYGYDKLSRIGKVASPPEELFKGEEGLLYYLVASIDGQTVQQGLAGAVPERLAGGVLAGRRSSPI